MLLAGYLYAHLLGRLRDVRHQLLIHMFLLVVPVAFLPIRLSVGLADQIPENPAIWLLGRLFLCRSRSAFLRLGNNRTFAPELVLNNDGRFRRRSIFPICSQQDDVTVKVTDDAVVIEEKEIRTRRE
jgi:hypothetical protein